MDNVDPNELLEVVHKYSGFINSLCKRYYLNGGNSDDLFEEGVIGILEASKNYKGKSLLDESFDPFVKICIKRQIIDAIKKANTQKNKILNESLSLNKTNFNGEENSMLNTFIDRNVSNDPLDLFLDKETIEEKLGFCKLQLSSYENEVLVQYLSGKKQSEIAETLGKDVKSVGNTIQRIKNKLK